MRREMGDGMSVWDWHISKAVSTLVAAGLVLALMGCAPKIEKNRCGNSEFCPPAARKGNYRVAVPEALKVAKANLTPAEEILSVLRDSGYTVRELSLVAYESTPEGLRKYRIDSYLKPQWINNGALANTVITVFAVMDNTVCQVGFVNHSELLEGKIYADCNN